MKNILVIIATLILSSCGAPQISNIPQNNTVTQPVHQLTESEYKYSSTDGVYFKKDNYKIEITDSTIVINDYKYNRIDSNTVAYTVYKKEGSESLITRTTLHKGDNYIKIGKTTYYKEIPPLASERQINSEFAEGNSIVVQEGWTLNSVSRRYNVSIDDLIQLNTGLSPTTKLQKGQIIKIY